MKFLVLEDYAGYVCERANNKAECGGGDLEFRSLQSLLYYYVYYLPGRPPARFFLLRNTTC